MKRDEGVIHQARTWEDYMPISTPSLETITSQYTQVIDALCDIAETYHTLGRQEDAVALLKTGMSLSGDETALQVQAKLLTSYGKQLTASMFRTSRTADEALSVLTKAREIAESLQDEHLLASVLYELGETYFVRGHKMTGEDSDYDTSLIYFQQALALREALHDEKNMPQSLLGVGRMYQNIGQNEAAQLYIERALQSAEQQQDKAIQGEATNHIAILKAGQDDIEGAIQLVRVAITIREQAGLAAEVPYSYLTLAELYMADGKSKEALATYQQCYALAEQVQATQVTIFALLGIGYIYLENGEAEQAREQFKQAETLAEAIGLKTGIQEAQEALEETDERTYS